MRNNKKLRIKNEKDLNRFIERNNLSKDDFDEDMNKLNKIITYLLKKYNFSDECIVKWGYSLRSGDSAFRADAVILDENENHLVVIEVKRSIETSLSIEYFKDLLKNTEFLFGVLTDGTKYIYFENDKNNKAITQIPELPNFKDLKEKPFVELRPFQKEAVDSIKNSVLNKERRILISLATGSGKTIITLTLINDLIEAKKLKKVLWLSDRIELTRQFFYVLNKQFKHIDSQIFGKDSKKESTLYISTLQTMYNKYKSFNAETFDLIIIDNCVSKIFGDYFCIFEYFKDAIILGFTSNINEKEDFSVNNYFGKPVYEYSLRNLIQDGYIGSSFSKDKLVSLKDVSDVLWRIMDILRNEPLSRIQLIDEISKILICKIYDEKTYPNKLKFQNIRNNVAHNSNYDTLNQLNQLLAEAIKESGLDMEPRFRIRQKSLERIIMILEGISFLDEKGKLIDSTIGEKIYSKIELNFLSGQYSIPARVVGFMLDLISLNKNEKIADLHCGFGDIIVKMADLVDDITGYDVNNEVIRIAKLRLLLSDRSNVKVEKRQVWDLSDTNYDKIVTVPPFGARIEQNIPREEIPSNIKSLTVFSILRALKILKAGGSLIYLMPEGVFFNKQSEYNFFRNLIKTEYTIRAIIALLQGAFPYTGINTSIILIEKKKPHPDSMVFMASIDKYCLTELEGLEVLKWILNRFRTPSEDKEVEFHAGKLGEEFNEKAATFSYWLKQRELDDNNFTVLFNDPSYQEEISKIKNKGRIIKLGKCADVFLGVSQKTSEYRDSGLRFIQIRDLGRESISNDFPKYIDPAYSEKNNLLTRKGDILLSVRGTIGKTYNIKSNEKGLIPSSSLVLIRAYRPDNVPIGKNDIDPLYLFHMLKSDFIKRQLEMMTTGAYIKGISIKDLKDLIIPYPDILRKREISQQMERLESELKIIEEKKKEIEIKIQEFKKNMDEMAFR